MSEFGQFQELLKRYNMLALYGRSFHIRKQEQWPARAHCWGSPERHTDHTKASRLAHDDRFDGLAVKLSRIRALDLQIPQRWNESDRVKF